MKPLHLLANSLACALLPAASAMAQPGAGRSAPQLQRAQPALQSDWSSGSDQRRTEIRQTLQAQHQADTLVGPQVAEPLASERHLTQEERLELRRQLRLLQLARQKQAESALQIKQ